MHSKFAPPKRTEANWVRDKLVAAGVRPTRQRLELGRLIKSCNSHFTAEMIYHQAQGMRFPPSLGTVYNTLNDSYLAASTASDSYFERRPTPRTRCTPRSGAIRATVLRSTRGFPGRCMRCWDRLAGGAGRMADALAW